MGIYLHPTAVQKPSRLAAALANIERLSGRRVVACSLRVRFIPTHTPNQAARLQPVVSGPTGGDAA